MPRPVVTGDWQGDNWFITEGLKPGERVVVLYDELDLKPGRIRVKFAGGAGGHNGIRSIDAHVGQDYWRVRIGIGHPGDKERVLGYVLQDCAKPEREGCLPVLLDAAEQSVRRVQTVLDGADAAVVRTSGVLDGADAAVVRQQWQTLEPLDSGERAQAVQVDATADPECTTAALRQRLRV